MTKLGNRQNSQAGQLTPVPAIECPGCGALHALIDRLTEAVERAEQLAPAPQPIDEPETAAEWTTNPDGIPDESEQKEDSA